MANRLQHCARFELQTRQVHKKFSQRDSDFKITSEHLKIHQLSKFEGQR